MSVIYEQLRYWLPLFSGFVFAYKGFKSVKKSLDGWAETHLLGIQDATANTVVATNKTNELLVASALHDSQVAEQAAIVKTDLLTNNQDVKNGFLLIREDIKDHADKEMAVWMGVVNTLSLLEDRGRRPTPRRRSPRRK